MNYRSMNDKDNIILFFFSNLPREKTRVEEANNEDSQEFERFSNGKWRSEEKEWRDRLSVFAALLSRPPS